MRIGRFIEFVGKLWVNPQLTDSSAGARGARAARQSAMDAIDRKMMQRCIALSRQAAAKGEMPLAAIICRGDEILAEVTNYARCSADATRHPEMVALSDAQRALGHKRLTGCTLYSNVEPCAMCSWPIRETGVSRVVFAIKSPHFGGLSRWNVLGDLGITNIMRGYFRKPPQVVAGLLLDEAAEVWRESRPRLWSLMSATIEPARPPVQPVTGPIKAAARKMAPRAANFRARSIRAGAALRPRRSAAILM
jgi:tRNA(adenine34) deaminase